ncbi:hypothetical protein L6164_011070 [Bauhinia variegata]|uniref:Uncharacterized protein n=1 Tax=Bauhinia variegata TaxID=167791 RepID=A0ACB9P5V8_BAUVA|nr:hypothetical protein L6164_011070 [Bauhinia variegata]
MKKSSNSESSKLDRKTIERNRRIHMKALCFKLGTLIPSHYVKPTKDMMSQQDQLDLAAAYIIHLKEKVEKLKGQKEQALRSSASNSTSNVTNQIFIASKLPVLELRDMGSCIEVMLITGLNKNFMLYEVISILEEEGAEVVSASFSTVGDKIFHTVHAQVKISRVGIESSRVHQRLRELIAPLESWDYLA